MGIYLNPGNMQFKEAVDSEIYIDKSMLIAFTNKNARTLQKNICVSRPRRFGKSMAADMLVAYYSRGCDSRELFKELKIAQHPSFEKHLNKYNVIHVNMLDELTESESVSKMIAALKKKILWELEEEFGEIRCYDWNDLVMVMKTIHNKTGQQFVIIIDEWDCLFRKYVNDTAAQKAYLDFLCLWMKGKSYIALAYMTGILPIKKYGEHSALNMFDEFSMTNQRDLAEFTGFTEQEVKDLCAQYDMPFEETKRWYDGYSLKGLSIYNPRSVVMSMSGHDFDSYWTKTETYESLKEYIQMDSFGLREIVTRLISGEHYPVNPDKFQNDMVTFNSADDVLTLLIHLGYLTYDFGTETAWIPNNEVQREFINSIEDGGWEHIMKSIRKSDELLEATINGKADIVAEMIEQAHDENTSILKYNDENSLSCVLSLAYYSAKKSYVMYRELAGGKGFADLVFIPRKECQTPAFIVELKWNKSAEAAIDQIKQKKYSESLKDYSGEILLVGLSYDKDAEKRHTCVIEKVIK